MKYFITLLTLVFLGLSVFAQEGQELSKPPQIFPVSPEAGSLGKYGEIPVNLSTGKINYTVPLYTIKVGGFEWPIYLSYNYGGLVNEQDHPMTGMGWDLMANGRITRQVRGIDDEYGNQAYKANTMIPYLQGAYNTLSDIDFTHKQLEIYDNIGNRNYDAQQDIYTINASGLDGRFVFNETGDIIFVTYKNYKVQKNGNLFVITSDNGIKYHFEIHELGTYHYNTGSESVDHTVPVSYLLTQIELTDHKGSIYFEYATAESYGKAVISESETIINGVSQPSFARTHSTMTRHKLQKIRFPNGEVQFNISSGTDQGIATEALNKISVWNGNNPITTYDFTYDDTSKNRKTLLGITKSNQGVSLPWYTFDYHPFPHTFPADQNYRYQDLWGFYNAVGSSLLTTKEKGISHQNTIAGALQKITYPTGGYSEITYEQNRLTGDDIGIAGNCTFSHNKRIEKTINGESGSFDQIVDTIIKVPQKQAIRVYSILKLGEGEGNSFIGTEADISITTQGESCGYKPINMKFLTHGETISCEQVEDCPDVYTEEKEELGFTRDGKIHIKVRLHVPFRTSASVKIVVRYEEREDNNELFKFVGGIRVSKTKDCNGMGDCKTKTYKYINADNTGSGVILKSPSDNQYTTELIQSYGTTIQVHRSAFSMANFTSYQGAPVFYPRVEIWEQNGTNGKTVNYFSRATSGNSTFPFVSPPNNDWKTGKLLKKEVFKYQPSGLVLQKEEVHEYDAFYPYGIGVNSTLKAYGMAVGRTKFHYDHTVLIDDDPRHYAENYYVDYPKEYKLVKTNAREFLNGKVVTNQISYTYDNPYGQLKTQTTTDSNGNTMTTTHSYPYDKSSAVNNLLVVKNRITTPVETKTAKNATVLGTQVTEFKDWGNGIILPEITKIAKGTKTPEPRLIYHKYDPQGNPLEVSQESGSHIMYIWGYYNTQPIVKIDNASYTGIPAAVTTLINQLKTTSDTENSEAKENTMRNLFKALRDHAYFANAQVSGYTYDPLIGVTSMTNPKGETVYYQYDDLNRLQYVLDRDGHIVQKTNYNYVNQQTNQYGAFNINITSPGLVTPNKPITFTASFAGGTGQFLYTWKVNGVQEQCDTSPSFIKTFSSEGEYTISVLAYDTQTKRSVSKILVVSVKYPPLATPIISDPYPDIIEGTQVTYTASNVSGGSGDLRYEWYLNGTKQSTTTTSYTYDFPANGTYTVYFKVIDNESGEFVNSNQRTIRVYNPLVDHVINGKSDIVKGTTVSFSGTGFAGGSGQRRYEWFIGETKQSATGTGMSYRFTSTGTYTVKLRVIDTKVRPTHYRDIDYTVKSYNPMVINVTPGNASLNNSTPSVRFNITSVTGGSGYYTRTQWKLWRLSNPSWTRNVGSGSSYTVGVTENGEYELSVTYTDTRTGQIVLKTMPIIVNKSSGGGDGPIGDQH